MGEMRTLTTQSDLQWLGQTREFCRSWARAYAAMSAGMGLAAALLEARGGNYDDAKAHELAVKARLRYGGP